MNKLKLKEILAKEKSLTEENSGLFEEIFKKKVEILSENLEETIAFFDECTQDEFFWMSNAFENISECFKSAKLIECLIRNQLRFPDISSETQPEIDYAIRIVAGSEN